MSVYRHIRRQGPYHWQFGQFLYYLLLWVIW
jgi:hypothetical protein